MLQGELDAAFVFKSSNYHELDETVLYNGQFQIAVKNKHPILKLSGKAISKELNELPAITFKTSIGPNFWANHPAFNSVDLKPKHTYFYEDTQTALQLLSSTNGWAFLPDLVIGKNKQIQKLPIFKDLDAPVKVSFIKKKGASPNSFIDRLKNGLLEMI